MKSGEHLTPVVPQNCHHPKNCETCRTGRKKEQDPKHGGQGYQGRQEAKGTLTGNSSGAGEGTGQVGSIRGGGRASGSPPPAIFCAEWSLPTITFGNCVRTQGVGRCWTTLVGLNERGGVCTHLGVWLQRLESCVLVFIFQKLEDLRRALLREHRCRAAVAAEN